MRILELHLLTNSLSASVEFYCDLLEFEMLESSDTLLTMKCGDTIINFRPSNGAAAIYHFAFEIPHNKFEEAYDWFKDRVEFIPITEDSFIANFINWKAKSFYFYDTNGNILECIARFESDTHSIEKFSSRSINYISEIGIVSDHVAETIHQVNLDFNVPIFKRQPALTDFVALGDDEGLFIVASNNRPWYPTQTRSQHCLTSIRFEQHGNIFEWTVGT